MSIRTSVLLSLPLVAFALTMLPPLAHTQNLFVADPSTGSISMFTPAGVMTTFASGLSEPFGLAFDQAGNLYATDPRTDSIFEFTPAGSMTTFATGVNNPSFLAFAPAAAPIPESISIILLAGMILAGVGLACRSRTQGIRA